MIPFNNVAFASNPPLLLTDKFIRFAEETPISILAIKSILVLSESEEIAEDPFLRMLLSIFIANVLAMAGVILFCCFLVDSRCLWIDWTIERSSADYLMFWSVSCCSLHV